MAILVPTCCQEVPNLTPRSPKRAQLVAKIAQNTPQEPPSRPPEDPKMWPKCGSVVRFYTSAIFLKIAPKTTKNAQKSSPNGLKMAILAPTWKLLAPSWLQLGPILAQLDEILADPSAAKIDQNVPEYKGVDSPKARLCNYQMEGLCKDLTGNLVSVLVSPSNRAQ